MNSHGIRLLVVLSCVFFCASATNRKGKKKLAEKTSMGILTTDLSRNEPVSLFSNLPKAESAADDISSVFKSKRTTSKKERKCMLPEHVSIRAHIINPEKGLRNWSIAWRILFRKIVKIYGCVFFSLAVLLLNPRLFGLTNPLLISAFIETIYAYLTRSENERKISDQSFPGFLMIFALKAETFIYHSTSLNLTSFKLISKLEVFHLIVLLLADLAWGMFLNDFLAKFERCCIRGSDDKTSSTSEQS